MTETFNTPLEEPVEIELYEFMFRLFLYQFKPIDIRQVAGTNYRIFPLAYDNVLGLAVERTYDRMLCKLRYKYYRYGGQQRWDDFELNFASQFHRDRS
jgi:hypothetical protein